MISAQFRETARYSIGILSIYPFIDTSSKMFLLLCLYIAAFLTFSMVIILIISLLSIYFKQASNSYILHSILSFIFSKIKILKIPIAGCTLLVFNHNISNTDSWTGENLAHKIIAIISFMILEIICFLIDFFLIDTRLRSKNITRKLYSQNALLEHMCRIVILIITIVINNETCSVISSILFVIIFGYQLYHYFDKISYIDPFANLWWKIYSGLTAWTGISFLISYFLLSSNDNSGFILLIVGSVLVPLCIWAKSKPFSPISFSEIRNISNDTLMIEHVIEKLILIEKFSEERLFRVGLEGMIIKHQELCTNIDCPFRAYKESIIDVSNYKEFRSKIIIHCFHRLSIYEERNRSDTFKLFYAGFLAEYLNNYKLSEKILTEIESGSSNLLLKFQVFLLKKRNIKKLSRSELHTINDLNFSELHNYETYINKFYKKIRIATEIHSDFWKELTEPHPDLTKIVRKSKQILSKYSALKNYWNTIRDFKIVLDRPLRIYIDFNNVIAHDIDYANELNEKLKEVHEISSNLNYVDLEEKKKQNDLTFSKEGLPIVLVSAIPSSLGIITSLNLPFLKLVGYKREELIGNNISKIIPEIYIKYHLEALENYMSKYEPQNIHELSKKGLIAQTKNKEIIPIKIEFLSYPSNLNNNNFVVSFQLDIKNARSDICFLLFDSKKVLAAISSSAYSMLGIRQKIVGEESIQYSTILPDLFDETKKCESTEGNYIPFYKCRNFSSVNLPDIRNMESLDSMSNPIRNKVLVKCNRQTIRSKNDIIIGYLVRLETIKINENELLPQKSDVQLKIKYDFTYNFDLNKFLLQSQKSEEPANSEKLLDLSNKLISQKDLPLSLNSKNSKNSKNNNNNNNQALNDKLTNHNLNSNSKFKKEHLLNYDQALTLEGFAFCVIPKLIRPTISKRIDFGDNIIDKFVNDVYELIISRKLDKHYCQNIMVYRFHNGTFQSLERKSHQPFNENSKESTNQNKNKNKSANEIDIENENENDVEYLGIDEDNEISRSGKNSHSNFYKSISSKTAFHAKLQEAKIPNILSLLNVISFIIFFVMAGIASTLFGLNLMNFASYSKCVSIMKEADTSFMLIHKSVYLSLQMVLLSSKILDNSFKYSQTLTEIAKESKNNLDDLYLQMNDLIITSFSQSYSNDYLYYFQNDSTEIIYSIADKSKSTTLLSLNEAIYEIMSYSYNLFTDYSLLNDTNPYFYYIHQNGLNSISIMFNLFIDKLQTILENFILYESNIVLSIFIASCIFTSIQIPVFLVIIYFIENLTLRNLKMLCEIPGNSFEKLYEKCFEFSKNLNYLQKGDKEKDEILEEDIVKAQPNDMNISQTYFNHRSKQLINIPGIFNKMLILLLGSSSILILYFFLIYFYDVNFIDNSGKFIKDFATTSDVGLISQFALNIEREFFYGSKVSVLNKKASGEVTLYPDILIQKMNDLSSMKGNHFILISSSLRKKIETIIYGNLCYDISEWKPFNSEHECLLFHDRESTNGLNAILADFSSLYKKLLTIYSGLTGTPEEIQKNIFNREELNDMYIMLVQYISPFNNIINELMIEEANNNWGFYNAVRIAIFVIFLVVSAILYFIIFRIAYLVLLSNFTQSKLIISILPLEIILGLHNLQKFILNNEK